MTFGLTFFTTFFLGFFAAVFFAGVLVAVDFLVVAVRVFGVAGAFFWTAVAYFLACPKAAERFAR